MQESIVQLQTYIRMVWRFRWGALVVAVIVCVMGWATVVLLPNRYEVTAKVFLDTRSLLRPLLKGLAVDSASQYDSVLVMRRTLLVRPNLEQVARKTDMDLQAETPQDLEKLLNGLAESIDVSGTSRDNIFVIAYENQDPKLATRVVDALLNLFVERQLGESRKDTSKSREFLDSQIKEYEARLIAAENRLKEFKRQNVGLMPSAGRTYYARLEDMAGQRQEAELELREAQNRAKALGQQLGGVTKMLDEGQDQTAPVTHPLDARINELESQLDQLLLQFTDKHPDVVAARSILEKLEKQREADLASMDEPQVIEKQRAQNPIYQELKVAAGAAVAEVAALKARVEEYKRREVELKKLVDTIPKVEAELVKLNRDYGIDQKNYDELVKRREALKISDDASQSTDEVQFNIIEPPREPLVPTSPDRPVLNAAVLVGGIAVGVAFAWLLAMMRPAFYTKEQFSELTELPVLGVVSRLWTPREMLRRRLEVASFAVGCLFLIGLYGALVALQLMDVDLVSKVGVLKDRVV